MSSAAKKGGKSAAKKGGKIGSPLHIVAFKDRVVVDGKVCDYVESRVTGPSGETMESSLPHLTHGTDARAAHITSSRVVAVSVPYVIHQRFHQNNDGQSEPTHDRYFAVHQDTGVVHGASAAFTTGVHKGKFDALPTRGETLATTDKVSVKLTFTVLAADDKVPEPLSPISRTRTLPSSGYKE